jgi:RecT family
MTTALSILKPNVALPMNVGIEPAEWLVLTNVIFPNTKRAEPILLAREYCRVRNLDIMKKPVSIVSVWDQRLNDGNGGYIDQIWPSINETQVTAARSGEWCGMDPPVWGPDVSYTFKGQKKRWARRGSNEKNTVEDVETTMIVPEWCAVTVYRLIGGQPRGFTEPVYWREAYGRVGGTELPNDMWARRIHGQLHKVAKAASLRAAFPEEGGFDEAESEGATVIAPDHPEPPKPRDDWRPPTQSQAGRQRDAGGDDRGATGGDEPPPHQEAPQAPEGTRAEVIDGSTGEIIGPSPVSKNENEDWITWAQRFLAHVTAARDEAEIAAWGEHNRSTLEAMAKSPEEGGAPKVFERMQAAINRHRMTLTPQPQQTIMSAG